MGSITMPNILITGSCGQLGSEIKELSKKYNDNSYFFTDRETLDITDLKATVNFINTNNIDVVINCAAYTAVDKAEEDEINANIVNHLAVRQMANIAKEKHIKLIHISTDYVFDGSSNRPYTEEDLPNPQGVYGATKLAGEKAMQEINPQNSIIIRASWVYSSYGNNFVKTMLRLGKERDEISVIFDQVGTPTYARDLAEAILTITQNSTLNSQHSVMVYHYSNEGVASWYDFAKAIFEMSGIMCEAKPIETEGYPTPATRPHYSVFNKTKIKKEYNITIPYWRDSLKECLEKMGETA